MQLLELLGKQYFQLLEGFFSVRLPEYQSNQKSVIHSCAAVATAE